ARGPRPRPRTPPPSHRSTSRRPRTTGKPDDRREGAGGRGWTGVRGFLVSLNNLCPPPQRVSETARRRRKRGLARRLRRACPPCLLRLTSCSPPPGTGTGTSTTRSQSPFPRPFPSRTPFQKQIFPRTSQLS